MEWGERARENKRWGGGGCCAFEMEMYGTETKLWVPLFSIFIHANHTKL